MNRSAASSYHGKMERTTRPYRPPVLTHVCKTRVGVPRAPSGFSLAANRQELAHQRLQSSRTPYFEVLDQNRQTSTCSAGTLRSISYLNSWNSAPQNQEGRAFHRAALLDSRGTDRRSRAGAELWHWGFRHSVTGLRGRRSARAPARRVE